MDCPYAQNSRGSITREIGIASCEAGGYVFAPALAVQVDVPFLLIREAGKLPPPTVSLRKESSYISSKGIDDEKAGQIEVKRGLISNDVPVLIVDDVFYIFSTGKTLCAILE